eukprot:COSAG01_NODE_7014_length_3392_cov_2.015791_3_plen_485_part_00
MSFYWSYYAALMGGACRLAAPKGGTTGFGGYIVPRRSGGAIDGALLRRVIALIGNGAKALTYYTFGPEYNYPGNCYSDSRMLVKILSQQREAHTLVGRAEEVLWPATKVASKVAILAHRSSEIWDPPGATKWEDMQQKVVGYQADQFGLYLALAVHGGVPVDFVDEDALANATLMDGYKVLFITQPNLPSASAAAAAAWVQQGGKLVLSGGAAAADEYNDPMGTLTSLSGVQFGRPMPRTVLHSEHGNPGALNSCSSSVNSSRRSCYAGDILLAAGVCAHSSRIAAYGGSIAMLTHSPNATVLATFAAGGHPAVLQTPVGLGSMTQFAWQPGLSYIPNASEYAYIPNPRTQLPCAVRELLVGLTKDSFTPPVRIALRGRSGNTTPGVVGMETPLLTSSAGACVTLLNWGGDAELGAELDVHIDLPATTFGSPPRVKRVFSARHGHLTHTYLGGQTVVVAVRAAYADFVVLLPTTARWIDYDSAH